MLMAAIVVTQYVQVEVHGRRVSGDVGQRQNATDRASGQAT
jgi:hypothetical protein